MTQMDGLKHLRNCLLLLFLLLPCTMGISPPFLSIGGGAAANPCITAGCTGTYDTCYTGEYAGDTDKACSNSGAAQVDGTHNGSPITTNGNVYLTIADSNDYIVWVPNSNAIDAAATVTFKITTPASFTAASFLAIVTTADKDDFAKLRIDGDGVLEAQYMTPASVDIQWHSPGPTLATSTTYNIKWSWTASLDDSYIASNAAEDEDTDVDINAFDDDVTAAGLGDYDADGVSDTFLMDNFKLVAGYDNTQPSAP